MTFNSDMPAKDPAEVKDYKFDFAGVTNQSPGALSDLLESGETITSKTVGAATGITVDSSAITDNASSVTVWLSGGTAGTDYAVSCQIDTSMGRTYKRTMTIPVQSL